jgi:WhiB family redox-sensing transcriptional regulator
VVTTTMGETSTADRLKWQGRGGCRSEDPELFFPIGDTEKRDERGWRTGQAGRQADKALKVCWSVCPVRAECLAWAVQMGPSIQGVWGGTTEQERAVTRRRVNRDAGRVNPRNVGASYSPIDPVRAIIREGYALGWTAKQMSEAWGIAREAVHSITSDKVAQATVRTTTYDAAVAWWKGAGQDGPDGAARTGAPR